MTKIFIGPLHDTSTNRQVGIVSYGSANCASDNPSVQSRVTDNLDYIEKVIRKTSRQQTYPETNSQTNGPMPPTNRPMPPTNRPIPITPTHPPTYPQTNPQTNPPTNPQTNPMSPTSSILNLLKPFWLRT